MEDKELTTVVNMKQAGRYIKHGCTPVKVTYENDNMVFYFKKKESYPLFVKWVNYELD